MNKHERNVDMGYKTVREGEIMTFDVNQTEFADDYGRAIWKIGINVVPLDISLANINDPETREGCTQIYRCTMEMLTDMYNNATDYKIIGPIDYLSFFFEWMTGKRHVPGDIRNRKGRFVNIQKKLQRFGFSIDGETLTNERYPLFMKYWLLLWGRCTVLYCDFRVLVPGYKRGKTLDDMLRPRSDRYKAISKALYEYALEIGARRLPYNQYKPYCFVYRKKHVIVLGGPIIEVPYMNQYTQGDMAGELRNLSQSRKRSRTVKNSSPISRRM